jgi:hypothetical protein
VNNGNIIKLYPNPVTDALYINTGTSLTSTQRLLIYDTKGRLVHQQALAAYSDVVNMKRLAKGMYQVQVVDGNNMVKASRMVVKE